jgi:hypothetical protein
LTTKESSNTTSRLQHPRLRADAYFTR